MKPKALSWQISWYNEDKGKAEPWMPKSLASTPHREMHARSTGPAFDIEQTWVTQNHRENQTTGEINIFLVR